MQTQFVMRFCIDLRAVQGLVLAKDKQALINYKAKLVPHSNEAYYAEGALNKQVRTVRSSLKRVRISMDVLCRLTGKTRHCVFEGTIPTASALAQ